MPRQYPTGTHWEAHQGEDYTRVMLPNETTDTASIDVHGEHALDLAMFVAFAPEALERANSLIDAMAKYIGKMALDADQLAALNEHWLFIELARHHGFIREDQA